MAPPVAPEPDTFAEAILGRPLLESAALRPLLSRGDSFRVVAISSALAALVFLPYLGAVGLWDPWETHYGEVARSMAARNDFVHPFWENGWFYSKPPLTMWMQSLGILLTGAMASDGALSRYTEWGMRLPFALSSIAAVALLALAVARIAGRRAGYATAFALCTMPLWLLLTRQAVTDTPFVTSLTCAFACLVIGLLDPNTRHRSAWWYGFYFFSALGMLAKGLLAVGIPAVVLVLYAVVAVIPRESAGWAAHWQWLSSPQHRADVRAGRQPMPVLFAQIARMRLATGILVFLATCAPWFITMSLFPEVDDEGRRFFDRFFIYDHFSRLAQGVHTTTPNMTFTYFIEQGGFALFPWVALVPGALWLAWRVGSARGMGARGHLVLLASLWALFTFFLISLSATKFHHYVFPVLPAVAILIGLFVDRLWRDGPSPHAASLVMGVVLFALVGRDLVNDWQDEVAVEREVVSGYRTQVLQWLVFPGAKHYTDLFVYNYDRPYPSELMNRTVGLFGRVMWTGDLAALILLALGGYLVLEAFARKGPGTATSRALGLAVLLSGLAILIPVSTGGRVSATLLFGIGAAVVAGLLYWESSRVGADEKAALIRLTTVAAAVAVALIIAGVQEKGPSDPIFRRMQLPVTAKMALGFALWGFGALCAYAALAKARTLMFSGFWALSLGLAVWLGWNHWVDLSHHWTQRDQFWRYYAQRREGEPIASYLMNWRGETFYSRNRVKQLRDNARLLQYVNQPGREWALVEHHRLSLLKSNVGADKVVTPVDPGLNNKFVLVTID